MKTFIALMTACWLTAAALAADATAIFQIRLVTETPTATSEPLTSVRRVGEQVVKETLNVEKAVLVDQTAIKSARVGNDAFGQSLVDITLTKSGAEHFAAVTQQNLHKRLAIVIDGHLTSAPMVQSEITSGKAQISGNFTQEQAADLANRINGSVKK